MFIRLISGVKRVIIITSELIGNLEQFIGTGVVL